MPAIMIPTRHGEIPTYVASPAEAKKAPGVVVIHDALGMSNDLRAQAEWLAAAGYTVAAPDLFYWGRKIACIRAVFSDIRSRQGRSFDEIDAVRDWLAGQDGCTGKVGVIGFCMGGGFALLLAPGHGFDASSVNYGSAPKYAYDPNFLTGACPIVGSYGAKDGSLRGAAAKLEVALTKAEIPHDVKEYPGAGHSFLNDHERLNDKTPLVMVVFGKLLTHAGYRDEAAQDARRRIIEFFDAHLRDPEATDD